MEEAEPHALVADVLVVGGGMAACWAAITAAEAGASVVLVDKGFVGTSGVTATGGPNHWWMPPGGDARDKAIATRLATAHGLADPQWMARVIETTWRALPRLARWYPFATDGRGGTYYSGLRGPEYLRALRAWAVSAGVRVHDHFPALELLMRDDGSVGGAAGYDRLGRRGWTARAGAVILATGGCAFRSGLLGSHTNTGDGYLMAAEAGASLSGMEFANAYSISPAWNSTRTLPYPSARFFDAEGHELDIPPTFSGNDQTRALATAMTAGPVYADLGDAPALLKRLLPRIQPASPIPFERRGIDLFRDRFEVRLFAEGTIRGVGGLRIAGDDCQTGVTGLYAAGDAATRELVAGATSGGGAQNSAWALTSGVRAGENAARASRAQRAGTRLTPAGRAGLRPLAVERRVDEAAALATVQRHAIAYDTVLWRDDAKLARAVAELEAVWRHVADHRRATGLETVFVRETAAMITTARWSAHAARARTESRGMHVRTDRPATDPTQAHRLVVGGLDAPWVRFERPAGEARAAA